MTVHWTTSDGTATAADNDYQTASGDITFKPGETTKQIPVSVIGDTKYETDETLSVTLSGSHNAIISQPNAIGTILNDDLPPSLSISDVSVLEGDSGTTLATFIVSLSASSGIPVTVNYATSDGTASTSDSDYQARNGTLTFLTGGPLQQTVTVPINGDTRNEPDETFFINSRIPLRP